MFGYPGAALSLTLVNNRFEVGAQDQVVPYGQEPSVRPAARQPSEAFVKAISILSYKGGVGKTTLTAKFEREPTGRAGSLLIDIDRQRSLPLCVYPPAVLSQPVPLRRKGST